MAYVFQTCKIVLGCGCLKELPVHAKGLGKRCLVVSGKGNSLSRSGVLDRITELLNEVGILTIPFNSVEPEPSLATVQLGVDTCHKQECDMVVAVGGGSSVDVGKAIAAIAGTGVDLYKAFTEGLAIDSEGLPCIAVPTTAGTGAEVTFNSVLTDSSTQAKLSIRGKSLLPTVAVVDPELTLSMGQALTANTGMDALTQAIESYVSKGASPVTDALALEAIRLIGGSLLSAYHDGANLEARSAVAHGSLLAGMALANARLGAVHGMAHSVGSRCGLAHGLVCAILLPYVVEYNLTDAGAAVKLGNVANILGCSDLVEHIKLLNSEMGIPGKLSEVGFTADLIETVISESLPSGSLKANPRQVSADDLRAILTRNAV